MLKNLLKAVTVLGLAAFVFVGVGCGGPKMGKYNLVVAPDASLRDSGSGKMSQVEVALVGVKEADAPVWREYKVDSFFSGNDAFRAGANEYTKTLTFSNERAAAQTIKSTDPIWNVWKQRGVTKLFVFANSKNLRVAPGAPELRRKELPLTTDRWKTDNIDIVVKSSGIDVPTPMEPAK